MNKEVFVSGNQINETLAIKPVTGKKNLEPFLSFAKENKLPFSILEDYQVLESNAEVHTKEADLWLCLEGEVTFICGGELVEPWFNKLPDGSDNQDEIRSKQINNGEISILHGGDWLWIPAGVPHKHTALNIARLVIIKIPVK